MCKWLIWRVREEPNSVQRCQFRFFKPITIKLAQQTRENYPKNSGENPGCFRALWETLSGTREIHPKRTPKSFRAREVSGSFEKRQVTWLTVCFHVSSWMPLTVFLLGTNKGCRFVCWRSLRLLGADKKRLAAVYSSTCAPLWKASVLCVFSCRFFSR